MGRVLTDKMDRNTIHCSSQQVLQVLPYSALFASGKQHESYEKNGVKCSTPARVNLHVYVIP